jgi:O-antigen/teichoic acid export membrane protein
MTVATEGVAAGAAGQTPPEAEVPVVGQGVRVMQNTVVVFIARIVGLVFAGAASIILARYLGVERLGEYAAIYAYLGLFVWLASFGVAPLVAREAAQHREQAGSILYTGACVTALFAVATAVVAVAAAPVAHLGGKFLPLLAIGAVEIFLLVPVALSGVIFQVDLRQWYNSAFSVIRQLLLFTIVIVFYFLGAPLLYVVLGRLAVAAVEAGLNFYFARRFFESSRIFLTPLAKMLLRDGFVVTLTTVAATIYLRIDQVMLHSMAGDQVLGPYAAAVRISELFEALPAAFGSSLLPLLCVSVAAPDRFRRHLDIGYRYMVIAAAGLSVAFCVGARPIMHLTYGSKFAGAAPLLAVLIWSEIPIFFGGILGNGMMAAGLQAKALWATAAGAIVNVALNIFFIPRWGAMGASWATLISYWMCWTLALLPFRSTRVILWTGLRLVFPITAVALLVAGLVTFLPTNDWIRLVVAGVAYTGLVCLLGFARKQDLEFLRQAWRSVDGKIRR